LRENLFAFREHAKVFSDNVTPDQGNGKRTDIANTNERPSVIVCALALAPRASRFARPTGAIHLSTRLWNGPARPRQQSA
jgi:hypothetical protein